jgi:hypothetical protein
MQPPSFIAFTGVDRLDLLPGMRRLSARYPIEWGVLVDPDQEDKAAVPERGDADGPASRAGPAMGGSYLWRQRARYRRRAARHRRRRDRRPARAGQSQLPGQRARSDRRGA